MVISTANREPQSAKEKRAAKAILDFEDTLAGQTKIRFERELFFGFGKWLQNLE